MSSKTVRFADLFCGCGAMRLGFERGCLDAGLTPECVWACDIDEHAVRAYRKNFPDDPFDPLCDIKEAGTKDIPDFDILLAGWPCPPFSIAGRQKGFSDPRGKLFLEIARIAETKQPAALLLENVDRLATHDGGRTLASLLAILDGQLGYAVSWRVLNSRDFGVPQNRARIFISAFRDGSGGFAFPNPTDRSKRLRDILESDPVAPRHYITDEYIEYLCLHREREERKGNGFGYVVRSLDEVASALAVGGMGLERNLIHDPRLSDFPVIKGAKSPVSHECIRRLTPLECERLQGMPDGFTEGAADTRRYRLTGNAVTVNVVREISKRLVVAAGKAPAASVVDPPDPVLSEPDQLAFCDLFCGAGGIRLAVETAAPGSNCVFSSEIDRHARRAYQANFGEEPCGDITKIPDADIPPHDLLCAGFPCVAFSRAGRENGFEDSDKGGDLFFQAVRIAAWHRPKLLFLENVAALVRHDMGRTMQTVLSVVESMGYRPFHAVLNASHYGCPTSRRRTYIVAFRDDLCVSSFDFPDPTMETVSLKDALLPDDETGDYVVCPPHEYRHRQTQALPNANGRSLLRPIRVGEVDGRNGQGYRVYSEFGHAVTICARAGGLGAKAGLYLVNGKVRRPTPRECARVMGFPDSFGFPVSDTQAYRQIGNSVAVPVVRMILEKALATAGLIGRRERSFASTTPSGAPPTDAAPGSPHA